MARCGQKANSRSSSAQGGCFEHSQQAGFKGDDETLAEADFFVIG